MELTANSLTKLLERLGEHGEQAGEKYEQLRSTLINFFEWRGAFFPEEYADETLNRIARKLDQGIEIRNIRGYSYEVARLVCLEALKGHDSRRASIEDVQRNTPVPDTTDPEREHSLACLDECLATLPVETQELITEYYTDEKGERVDRRRALADRLGLRRDALANRAQRVRDKLEQCVTRCLKKRYE